MKTKGKVFYKTKLLMAMIATYKIEYHGYALCHTKNHCPKKISCQDLHKHCQTWQL